MLFESFPYHPKPDADDCTARDLLIGKLVAQGYKVHGEIGGGAFLLLYLKKPPVSAIIARPDRAIPADPLAVAVLQHFVPQPKQPDPLEMMRLIVGDPDAELISPQEAQRRYRASEQYQIDAAAELEAEREAGC
jgi:hypothetical protein